MAVSKIDLTRQAYLSGDFPLGSHKLTGLTDPTSAQDAATKAYVDAAAAGISWKASVRAATTANGALATAYQNGSVIDGVTLATGDRILIKDQSTASENGIYTVNASGTPTRATDADTNAEFPDNTGVFVQEGTTNADSGWTLTNNGAIVLGTTGLVFTQFTGLGQVTAGNVLSKSGNTIQVGSMATGTVILGNAGTPTITALSGDVTVGATGVTAIGANKVTLGMQATLAANTAIANATGSSATPTAVPMVSAPTASAIAIRDSNANIRFNNAIEGLTTTATAAATTTLTAASNYTQQFTGTTTQTVVLPDATTLSVGHSFMITNRSTGAVTVNANGGGLLQTMSAGSQLIVTAVTVGTTAGTWDVAYSTTSSGTVTAVSVASANGFAGSSSGGATPALTISTSITGILKGNGTAISAATLGTDYVAPSSFVDKEIPTGSINGSNTTFTLANTPVSGSEHVFLNGILQESGAGNDYTISTNTITYLSAPATGDKLRVTYRK